jgi:hypothetical protein
MATKRTPPPQQIQTPEEILADRVYFSTDPRDVNYIVPEQYALLLDIAPFLTQENIQKYFVDFYQHKKPCCCRTLYIYFTRVVTKPSMAHLAHYRHNGKMVHTLEMYNQAMASEKRRFNDVFGRNVLIQVRVKHNTWVPIAACQMMFCYMLHKMHLFDHIHEFLAEIKDLMEEEEEQTKKSPVLPMVSLQKQHTVTTDSIDFHMVDQDDWKVRMDVESDASKKGPQRGIDFYMC